MEKHLLSLTLSFYVMSLISLEHFSSLHLNSNSHIRSKVAPINDQSASVYSNPPYLEQPSVDVQSFISTTRRFNRFLCYCKLSIGPAIALTQHNGNNKTMSFSFYFTSQAHYLTSVRFHFF